MTVYRNTCVVRISDEETFFKKKGLCESIDECCTRVEQFFRMSRMKQRDLYCLFR